MAAGCQSHGVVDNHLGYHGFPHGRGYCLFPRGTQRPFFVGGCDRFRRGVAGWPGVLVAGATLPADPNSLPRTGGRRVAGTGRGAAQQADTHSGLDQAGVHPVDRYPTVRTARPASGHRHRLSGPCPRVAELEVNIDS